MARPQDKDQSRPDAPPRSDEDRHFVEGHPPEYLSADDDPEDEVELSSEDSFPASDPPSYTPVRRHGVPKDKHNPQRESPGKPET